MRAVLQRVSRAGVTVADEKIAEIGSGLLVLLGVEASGGWSAAIGERSGKLTLTVALADETGRVLDYVDKGDDNRKLCSLYLSIANRMGLEIDHFGDADSQLANL